MTKELERYLVKKVESLEQAERSNNMMITGLKSQVERLQNFEEKAYKFAKLIKIIPAHTVEDKEKNKSYDIDEYLSMDSFYRDKDPELYDFVINELKWDEMEDRPF